MILKSLSSSRGYPSDEALRRFYEAGWETVWLKGLDEQLRPRHTGYHRRMEAMFKALELSENDSATILDAGCGIGIYAINLTKRWPKAQVTAFDLSTRQIEVAKQLAEQQGVASRCYFFVGDVNTMLLAKPFGFIICTELLEHLPDPIQALGNLRAMGTKDTVYVFSVPQFYHGRRQSGVFFKQVLPNGGEVHTQNPASLVERVPVYEYYHASYTLDELSVLLKKCGFCIERASGADFVLPPVEAPSYLGIMRVWRLYNVFAKVASAVSAHFPVTLDSFLNGLLGNRWAATLVVRCRVK